MVRTRPSSQRRMGDFRGGFAASIPLRTGRPSGAGEKMDARRAARTHSAAGAEQWRSALLGMTLLLGNHLAHALASPCSLLSSGSRCSIFSVGSLSLCSDFCASHHSVNENRGPCTLIFPACGSWTLHESSLSRPRLPLSALGQRELPEFL